MIVRTEFDLIDKIEGLMATEDSIDEHFFWQPQRSVSEEMPQGEISGFYTSERVCWQEGGDNYRVIVDNSGCSGNAAVHVGYFKNGKKTNRKAIEDSLARIKFGFLQCSWMANVPFEEIHKGYKFYQEHKKALKEQKENGVKKS